MVDDKDIIIIEDCAQCCGAEYKGKKAGSLGDTGYFTFGLTKNITCLSGGIITTSDDDLARKTRGSLKNNNPKSRIESLKTLVLAMIMDIVTTPWIFNLSLYPFLRIMDGFNKDILQDMFDEPVRLYGDIDRNGAGRNFPNFVHGLTGSMQILLYS